MSNKFMHGKAYHSSGYIRLSSASGEVKTFTVLIEDFEVNALASA